MPLMQSRVLLDRLRGDSAAEDARVERVLAVARAFLSTSSLIAIFLDPTEPTRYVTLAYALLVSYALYSWGILATLRFWNLSSRAFRVGVHLGDIIWPAVLTLFTEGPNSPFFVIFLFALLAAAYRWGFRETIASAMLGILLVAAEALAVGPLTGATGDWVEGEFEVNRLVMRATYLIIMGLLLGYLSEQEKFLRAETAAVARLLARLRPATGMRETLETVLDELMKLFDSPRAVLALQEPEEGVVVWNARRLAPAADISLNYNTDSANRSTYFFPWPARSWQLLVRGGRSELVALNEHGRTVPSPEPAAAQPFIAAHQPRAYMAVSFQFADGWQGRLFLLDSALEDRDGTVLRLLQHFVDQLSPAIYSAYLFRRLRARAGAMERARVARELHDGAIQALTGLEMHVSVLRNEALAEAPRIGGELQGIQEVLRREILDLRELMDHLRPLEIDSHQLLDFLADTVEKFRRETGIAAEFVTDLDEVRLQPQVCRELGRIVQEALVNVRRHAQARNVMVRLGSQDGNWTLVVDDDGRGFPFSGKLDHAEMEAARKGPLVIRERVRAFGGRLDVESAPGRGARLEITIPRKLGL